MENRDRAESSSMPKFSVVVPVFNEQESLSELYQAIAANSDSLTLHWEVIFVDDGSSDDSWGEIEKIIEKSSQARGVRFRRNFGKASALQAGVQKAKYSVVFTMDADLQDDPKAFGDFLSKLNEGFDVVSGWKQQRYDPITKTVPSKVFNGMVGILSGLRLNDHNCGFKCYRKEVFSEIRLYGELHRFVPVLADAKGFKVAEIPVPHHARKFGSSKYGWRRLYRGLLDLMTVLFLTSYRHRPGHFLGFLGAFFFLLGSAALSWLAGQWILDQSGWISSLPLHQRPLMTYSIGSMLLGAQFLSMSFLAELITAGNHESGTASSFSVKECQGFEEPEEMS